MRYVYAHAQVLLGNRLPVQVAEVTTTRAGRVFVLVAGMKNTTSASCWRSGEPGTSIHWHMLERDAARTCNLHMAQPCIIVMPMLLLLLLLCLRVTCMHMRTKSYTEIYLAATINYQASMWIVIAWLCSCSLLNTIVIYDVFKFLFNSWCLWSFDCYWWSIICTIYHVPSVVVFLYQRPCLLLVICRAPGTVSTMDNTHTIVISTPGLTVIQATQLLWNAVSLYVSCDPELS